MADSEKWAVSAPKVIEVGGPDETVHELRVALVAGRIDVVAHDEDTARVEVHRVGGRELEVTWERGSLVVRHPQVRWDNILEGIRGLARGEDSADLSIAVPRGTSVQVGTVSADGLVAGLHAPASVRTVSGALVLDGVHGTVGARTLSGQVDVRDQHGALSGESVSGSLTVQGGGRRRPRPQDRLGVARRRPGGPRPADRPQERVRGPDRTDPGWFRIPLRRRQRRPATSSPTDAGSPAVRPVTGPGSSARATRRCASARSPSAGTSRCSRATTTGPSLTKTVTS